MQGKMVVGCVANAGEHNSWFTVFTLSMTASSRKTVLLSKTHMGVTPPPPPELWQDKSPYGMEVKIVLKWSDSGTFAKQKAYFVGHLEGSLRVFPPHLQLPQYDQGIGKTSVVARIALEGVCASGKWSSQDKLAFS